jgi:hypothetical protein
MKLALHEVIISAAIAKLSAGLPSRIAAINTEAGPASGRWEVQLNVPSESDVFPFGIDGDPSRFPAYIVGHGVSGDEFAEEGPHSLGMSMSLAVAVIESDADRQRLGWKLTRQQRAILEVLWDDEPKERLANPNGGIDAAYSLRPEGGRPGRALAFDEKSSLWLDMTVLYFRAWRVEE